MIVETADLECPIGTIRLAARERRLCALGFADRWPRLERALRRRFPGVELRPGGALDDFLGPLGAYFGGDFAALDALGVDPGGTPFQQRVWSALRAIPCGRTVSYAQLARSIGAPSALRAAGLANASNPVSIVVPCHRVIGSDGRLTGYGGGIERKRWLLAHERAIRAG